jgi:hypothetical protein
MNGFTDAELLTMLDLLVEGKQNLPAFSDGIAEAEMHIIIQKINAELWERKAA